MQIEMRNIQYVQIDMCNAFPSISVESSHVTGNYVEKPSKVYF